MNETTNPPLKRARWGAFEGELEKVGCRLCNRQDENDRVYRGPVFSIYRCHQCHLMYCSPRFTEQSLLAIYENEEVGDLTAYKNWSYENWPIQNPRSYTTERHKVAVLKQYLPEGARILDVGCSTGHLVLEASRQGFAAEGLEPSQLLSAVAKEVLKVPVTRGQLEEFHPGYSFDAIVIWDVLEHLYEPVRVVRRAAELLKPGGILLVQAPHYLGLSHRLKTRLCQWGLKRSGFKHFGFPWHVYSFDKRSLTKLLDMAELTPFRFESWPRQMKDGKSGPLAGAIIAATRRWRLSDYIMCIARKNNGQ